MNVLEKILKEIDNHAIEFESFGMCDDYVSVGWVKEIIRHNMNHNGDDTEMDGWILCSERLPEESGHYRVTVKNITEEITEQTAYFTEGQWRELYKCEQVIAWRKMQPYISESLAEREGE